jgi:hypothetical protein
MVPLGQLPPLAPGQRVRCPQCGAIFVPPANVAPPSLSPVTVTPPLIMPSSTAIVPEVTPIATPPMPAGAPATVHRGVVLGVLLGGLLLLAGASVGLAMLFSGGGNTPAPSGQGTKDDRQARNTTNNREQVIEGEGPNDGTGHDNEHEIIAPLLPPEKQAKVNAAIDKGVKYLRDTQGKNGQWLPGYGGHPLGSAALPALTLLECGVPGSDLSVQNAATTIRNLAASNNQTYDIALAILFLDRLGDPKDRELIQSLGLRLIAGQTVSGGWVYTCNVLSATDSESLKAALQATRPLSSKELYLDPGNERTKAEVLADLKARFARAIEGLPNNLKRVAVLQAPDNLKEMPRFDPSDNSNTQFGLLGVWVAARHGVPTQRALALVSRRFRTTQHTAGGWGYKPGMPATFSMTAAGLLGLAVGHGLDTDDRGANTDRKKVDDEQIKKGLLYLSRYVDPTKLKQGEQPLAPAEMPVSANRTDSYFLWSLERVGVLYDTRTIGDKDWYVWGSDHLVGKQQLNGSWSTSYGPSIDTSFALLFLKRANLVKDLSNKVHFVIESK